MKLATTRITRMTGSGAAGSAVMPRRELAS